jgi:hypothetical protein
MRGITNEEIVIISFMMRIIKFQMMMKMRDRKMEHERGE